MFRTPEPIRRPHVSIGIRTAGRATSCSAPCWWMAARPRPLFGDTEFACRLRRLPLLPRVYELWCSVRSEHALGDLFDWQPIGAFRVAASDAGVGPAAQAHTATDGPVFVEHEWEVTACQ